MRVRSFLLTFALGLSLAASVTAAEQALRYPARVQTLNGDVCVFEDLFF